MKKTFYDDKGQIIIEAPLDKESMLFIIKPTSSKSLEGSFLADSKPDNKMDLWHVRMGHPNDEALKNMIETVFGVRLPTNAKSFIL
jgi:hypothetical protein